MADIGRYEVLGRLASGGMAELLLARARGIEGFEKIVVLKRILPGRARDDDFVTMFLQEARLAGTLHHSNIVQVYDIGVEDGSFYFTMEYLRGKDLRDLARATFRKKQRVPLPIVVQIIAGVAAGLHYAHEKCDSDGNPLELVHRDVSPANVFVTWDGGVKLVDFGIAKAASAESTTRAGILKGKVPYMSPEQCQGKSLDRRSDVFALGTLLWEYSVGRRLWKGEHELMTIKKIANDAPIRPSSFLEDFPKDLERIILKALANDRDERYQTAQELQIALEDFARDNGWVLSSARLSQYLQETFPDQTTIDTVIADLQPFVTFEETTLDTPASPEASGGSSPVRVWLGIGAVAVLGLGSIALSIPSPHLAEAAGDFRKLAALESEESPPRAPSDEGDIAQADPAGLAPPQGLQPPPAPPVEPVVEPTPEPDTQTVGADGQAPSEPDEEPPNEPPVEAKPAKKKAKKTKKKAKPKAKKPKGPIDPDALFPPD